MGIVPSPGNIWANVYDLTRRRYETGALTEKIQALEEIDGCKEGSDWLGRGGTWKIENVIEVLYGRKISPIEVLKQYIGNPIFNNAVTSTKTINESLDEFIVELRDPLICFSVKDFRIKVAWFNNLLEGERFFEYLAETKKKVFGRSSKRRKKVISKTAYRILKTSAKEADEIINEHKDDLMILYKK